MTDPKNNTPNTEALIDSLANRAEAITPSELKLGAGVAWFFTIAAIATTLMTLTSGLRADVASGNWPTHIILGVSGALLVMAASTHGAVRLFLPGRSISKVTTRIIVVGLFFIVASVGISGWSNGHWSMNDWVGINWQGFHCTAALTAYATVCSVALILGARRYAPTKLVKLGLLIGATAFSAAYIALAVHCESNDVVHIFLYHLAPAVGLAIGTCGLVASRLRW